MPRVPPPTSYAAETCVPSGGVTPRGPVEKRRIGGSASSMSTTNEYSPALASSRVSRRVAGTSTPDGRRSETSSRCGAGSGRSGRRAGAIDRPGPPERGPVVLATIVVVAIICGASLFKTLALRSGGAGVARSLGGTRVERGTGDVALKRL